MIHCWSLTDDHISWSGLSTPFSHESLLHRQIYYPLQCPRSSAAASHVVVSIPATFIHHKHNPEHTIQTITLFFTCHTQPCTYHTTITLFFTCHTQPCTYHTTITLFFTCHTQPCTYHTTITLFFTCRTQPCTYHTTITLFFTCRTQPCTYHTTFTLFFTCPTQPCTYHTTITLFFTCLTQPCTYHTDIHTILHMSHTTMHIPYRRSHYSSHVAHAIQTITLFFACRTRHTDNHTILCMSHTILHIPHNTRMFQRATVNCCIYSIIKHRLAWPIIFAQVMLIWNKMTGCTALHSRLFCYRLIVYGERLSCT